MRIFLYCSVLVIVVGGVFLSWGSAKAEETEMYLDIPAQNVNDAVKALGRAFGYPVLFYTDDIVGAKANALNGEYRLYEALKIMLRGTSLWGGLTQSGVITITDVSKQSGSREGSMKRGDGSIWKLLLGGASSAALGVAGGVNAQSPDDGENVDYGRIESIVVTAERRQESSQDVPISMSVFGKDFLRKYMKNPYDVARFTSNYQVTGLSGMVGATATIRGLGSTGQGNPLANSSVLTYYDGIPAGSQAATTIPQWDLERVEVLKGPQGTLFGRNAVGGAVQYISQAPGDEFEGFGEFTVGQFNLRRFEGGLTVPVSDTVRARLSGLIHDRGGDVENTFLGIDQNEKEWWGLRAIIDWDASDNLSFRLKGQHFRADEQVLRMNSLPASEFTEDTLAFLATAGVDVDLSRRSNYSKIQSRLPDPYNRVESNIAEINLRYDFGPVEMNAIGGYLGLDRENLLDDVAYPIVFADQTLPGKLDQWTGELRFTSQTDSPLQWIVGGFYQYSADSRRINGDFTGIFRDLDGDGRTRTNPDSPEDGLDGIFASFPGVETVFFEAGNAQELNTWAVFLHTTYQWTDRLSTTHAVRYSRELRDMDFRFSSFLEFPVSPDVLSGSLGQFNDFFRFQALDPNEQRRQAVSIIRESNALDANGEVIPLSRSKDTDDITWRFAVDYMITDSALLYASVSKGWRGSLFPTLVGNEQVSLAADPETTYVYEIGGKTQFFDNRLQANFSVFYNDHRDFQDTLITQDLEGGQIGRVSNIPKTEIYGGELEVRMLPVDNLLIGANLGVLQTEIVEVPPGNEALLGNELPFAEDINFSGFILYDYRSPWGVFTPEFSWRYRGEYWSQKTNDDIRGELGNFWTLDLRLSYGHPDENFYAMFYVDNILDEVQPLLTRTDFRVYGTDNAFVNERRNWGLAVGYRF